MLFFSINFSTICIAFVAAPLRMLSATTHKFKPESTDSSLRILPTNTSLCSEAFVANG